MSWIGVDATLLAFVLGYTLSMMYITVFYHRGFTHNAVELNPSVRRFVLLTGPWLTGLDVRGWACMHRMHHQTTDVPGDPHSPVEVGMLGSFSRNTRATQASSSDWSRTRTTTSASSPTYPSPSRGPRGTGCGISRPFHAHLWR